MTEPRPQAPTSLRWWDVGVSVVILLMCVPGGASALDWSDTAVGWGGRLALNLGVLAVFALVYVTLGRPALRRGIADQQPDARGLCYLALLVAVLGLASAIEPSYATLQALAYPMAWVIAVKYWHAVIWSGLLATAIGVGSGIAYAGAGFAYDGAGIEYPIWTALAVAALSFAFSVVLGTWISRIFEQSEKYREAVAELQRSQREVAALSSEAGAAAERERLSRELHDTLTQTLAGLVMLGEQATRALDAGDTGRARDRVARVESAARAAVAEARALVAATQPLGEGGLDAAIARVAARMAADTGLLIECAVEPVTLGRERQVVLLRATQEGLANARKHARASRVTVTLDNTNDGGAMLQIQDDGVGPGASSKGAGGFGLSGLADRVRAFGGEVSFGPAAAGGSLLRLRLPGGGEAA